MPNFKIQSVKYVGDNSPQDIWYHAPYLATINIAIGTKLYVLTAKSTARCELIKSDIEQTVEPVHREQVQDIINSILFKAKLYRVISNAA